MHGYCSSQNARELLVGQCEFAIFDKPGPHLTLEVTATIMYIAFGKNRVCRILQGWFRNLIGASAAMLWSHQINVRAIQQVLLLISWLGNNIFQDKC